MSSQLFKQDILFYQRFLKANGFFPFKLTGIWGPDTDAADSAFQKESETIKANHGEFHSRSETNIVTLAPKVQILSRRFLGIVTSNGLDVRIISGTRTYAEQDALFRKGRFGNTEKKVTNAKGGQSNHNFGLAWDIGLFENGKYITTDKKYKDIAPLVLGVLANLEWGGDWITFKDFPHYQHTALSTTVSGVRTLFEEGKPYL